MELPDQYARRLIWEGGRGATRGRRAAARLVKSLCASEGGPGLGGVFAELTREGGCTGPH